MPRTSEIKPHFLSFLRKQESILAQKSRLDSPGSCSLALGAEVQSVERRAPHELDEAPPWITRPSPDMRSCCIPDCVCISGSGPPPKIPFIVQERLSGLDHDLAFFLLENNHTTFPKVQHIPHFFGERDTAFRHDLRRNVHVGSLLCNCVLSLVIVSNAGGIIKRKIKGIPRPLQGEKRCDRRCEHATPSGYLCRNLLLLHQARCAPDELVAGSQEIP
jgi:hypothetical protein